MDTGMFANRFVVRYLNNVVIFKLFDNQYLNIFRN
jgi:hypothetical protein